VVCPRGQSYREARRNKAMLQWPQSLNISIVSAQALSNKHWSRTKDITQHTVGGCQPVAFNIIEKLCAVSSHGRCGANVALASSQLVRAEPRGSLRLTRFGCT